MAKKSKETLEDISKVTDDLETNEELENGTDIPNSNNVEEVVKTVNSSVEETPIKENNSAKIVAEDDLLIKSIKDLLISTKDKLSPNCLKQNPSFVVNTGYNFYFCILKILETNIKNPNKLQLILEIVREHFSKYNKYGLSYKFFVRYGEEWNKMGYKDQFENFKALIEVFDKVSNGNRNSLDLKVFNSTTINPEVKQAIKNYFIK